MIKCLLTSDTHYGMNEKTHAKHIKFWKKVSEVIKNDNIDVMIWAGDIASHRLRQFKKSIEMAREQINIPILVVKGNHDYWDRKDDEDINSGKRTLNELIKLQAQYMKDNNIHYLTDDGPFVIDDVLICGFDGWYPTSHPNTNDEYNVPKHVDGEPIVMSYLVNKAWKDFEKCLEIDTSKYRKSIIVTHHNCYHENFDGMKYTTDEMLDKGYNHWGHSANYKFLPEIRDKFDVLCCGHTHVYKNDYYEGIQIYNCGSDYNNPKYLVFEV